MPRRSSCYAAAFVLLSSAARLHAQALAMTPLRSARSLSLEEVRDRRREFLPWVDSNATRLSDDDLEVARERLYLLIGSVARAYLTESNQSFPTRDTLGLAELFDYGSRLRLQGSGLVARALAPATKGSPSPIGASGKLTLSFAAPAFTLRSERGWTARFPYYFMISHAETTTPKNDVETDVVMLSTLFGRHRDRPGGSQATILLVAASPTGPDAVERFVRFWLGETRITEKDAVADALVADSRHYRQYDTVDMMDKEIVTLQRGQVVMIVEYIGVPGTFEANRQDFLDVVRGLHFTGSK
jgi:hypothetical protein